MNQNGVTPKQRTEFYGLLMLIGVVLGSIAGSYLFPALGLCQSPSFLGQVLGGAVVMAIVIVWHNRRLEKENAELRLIISVHELGASILTGALSAFGRGPAADMDPAVGGGSEKEDFRT